MANAPILAAAAAPAPPLFNFNQFITRIKPLIRKQRGLTFAKKDIVNDYIYIKQHELDPSFIIPATHTSRFHSTPPDSDSAISEIDPDEEELRRTEKIEWLNTIIPNLERIFSLIMNTEGQRRFARGLADRFSFTAKQMTLLNVIE